MIRINEKPLSVNDAWKGRRFKSAEYTSYQTKLLWLLPCKIHIPDPPFEIYFRFGFSSVASDWDNPVKPLQDILAKKYGFNDKLIRRAIVDTEIVPKGQEFFEFELKSFIGKFRLSRPIVNPKNMIKETDRQMEFMSGVDWNDTQTQTTEKKLNRNKLFTDT